MLKRAKKLYRKVGTPSLIDVLQVRYEYYYFFYFSISFRIEGRINGLICDSITDKNVLWFFIEYVERTSIVMHGCFLLCTFDEQV